MPTRARKQQSRLTFTPLPSSSPAVKDYNKQIQERAAAVGYEGSPSPAKRRRVVKTKDVHEEDNAHTMLPTPVTSLPQQDDNDSGSSDSEPVRSTQKRQTHQNGIFSSSHRARQQRLDFGKTPTRSTVHSSLNVSSPTRANKHEPTMVSSDESDGLSSLTTKAHKTSRKKKSSRTSETPGGFMASSGKRPIRSSQNKSALSPVAGSESEEDESSNQHQITVQNIHHGRREDMKTKDDKEDDDNEEDDDDEDDMPTTIGSQRKRRGRVESKDNIVSSSPPAALESDDELQIIDPPKKRQRLSESDDNDDDVAVTTPGRRRLKRRRVTEQEQNELEEDLEFLGPSSDVDESHRPRTTQSIKKDARLKALERLKLQRSGQAVARIDVDDEESGLNDQHIDGSGEGTDFSDNERTPQPLSSRQMFQADEEDEGFLVDEGDDEPLGVREEVPLAFTHFAAMKAKDLFKYAVEWMVHKKINPAFRMDDEIYVLAFKKLDDEVAGLAGSKFISSAWTPDFTMALKSRPDIAYEEIDRNSGEHWLRDHCDACNRSNHPAKFQIQFQGKTYNRTTLEEIGRKDDDEDDDEDEDRSEDYDEDAHPAYDADGREVPAADAIYYVGKFCMSNAQTAHSLQHWRYHLNEWVVQWIDQHGYSTPEKLVQRDRWSTKKRQKAANKIADRMEKEGVIKQLQKEFRRNINEAANAKQDRW